MSDLIDRAALLDFMDRVCRNMEPDMLAAGNEAYLRGYRAALSEVSRAQRVSGIERLRSQVTTYEAALEEIAEHDTGATAGVAFTAKEAIAKGGAA